MSSSGQHAGAEDVSKSMNTGSEEVDRREPFVLKVYATLFIMLLTTILMAFFFYR